MFRKKPILWAAVIIFLALLNLWKWLPFLRGGASGSEKFASRGGLFLNFPQPLDEEGKKVRRDLFETSAPSGALPRVRAKIKAISKLPVPSSAPSPAASAQATQVPGPAGGYKLIGVVFRGGKSQALLGKGDQVIQVAPGDEIEGGYRVDSIDENEVYLTEKQTGNTLKLHISDPQGEPQ